MAKLSQIKLGNTTYDIGAAWGNITGKPSTFPPSSHNHDSAYAKLTSPNNLVHSGNEFTFASDAFSGDLYINYRTANNSQNGDITAYRFYKGAGSTLSNIVADTFIGKLNGNADSATVSNRSQHLETWYTDKSKTYGSSYPLYAWWETSSECRLIVDNYTVKVNYADSAGTCTSLSTNAGSATKAIYFTGGKPAQCSDTINHNISGYSASLAYPAQVTTDANIDGFLEANRFKVGTWNSTSSPGVNNGIILSGGWTSASYGFQIAIDDDPTYFLALRQKDGSGWKAWKRIPMADGTGASGTWGINVTGSAGSVAWGNVTGKPSSYTPSSHSHSNITYLDTRSDNQSPDATVAGLSVHLKGNGTDGVSDGGNYHAILNVKDWGDYSGGPYWQATVTVNDNMYYRRSTSGTAWGGWRKVWAKGDSVTGAVWNDYAECRESQDDEPGYVLIENGDDTLSKSTERLQQFAGISSDTWGFSQGKTKKAKTHIAVAGRVLAYPYQDRNKYKPGDAVCTAPGGTVDIMTEEEIIKYPHRIVGTVSCVPEYEEWGGGENADRDPVKVNGRIWIKVK